MAIRDGRRSKGKLLLFVMSISLGIAALVGITSFRENLLKEIDEQAKTLIGADVSIQGSKPLPDSLMLAFYGLSGEMSRETYFASMVYFPRTDGTRLAQVRALSGKYPYYGNIETTPVDAAERFQKGAFALVDDKLMIQYGVEIGDDVKVGTQNFEVIGRLHKIPGQTDIGASAAPVVYISFNVLDQTQLFQKGSRVNYLNYFQFSPEIDTTGQWSQLVAEADKKGFDVEDIEKRKTDTGSAFKDLSNFLELVAFTALLLGCIGVASSMFVYTRDKVATVATLRCLGMKSGQAISIFIYQVAFFGIIGSILGALMGVALHLYLPELVKDFIPVELTPSISWLSILSGIGIGSVVSILFALISLVSLRNIPLQAIRSESESGNNKIDGIQILVGGVIFLFVLLLIYLQIGSFKNATFFAFGLVITVVILGLIGKGLALTIKKLLPSTLPYAWRQGLSNLYRPHNQTSLLITTLGLGTAFIATLLFMQSLLVDRVSIAGAEDRPNTVLFDIQTPQKEAIRNLTLDYDLPVMQEVPIVTMRLLEINGVSKNEAYNDTTITTPDWAYNREYRVTYRDSLISSETLSEGVWTSEITSNADSIFVSVSSGYAENLELKLGDELLFNVQGAVLKTYIGSFREVDWRRVQTNFLVVFPKGVLENAPQFHVLITRINNNETSARFQQAVVRSFPNVSIIDLELILKTLEDILAKIAFVIRFMAYFSIGTGIIMLISSIILSRFQRMRENVLLRTMGASSRTLWTIIFAEYFFLGLLGALSGIVIAGITTTLLGKFVFEFTFVPDLLQMLGVGAIITSITVIIGLLNSRDIIRQSPLEVLRNES
jgi:putative ABC transport system permease protein